MYNCEKQITRVLAQIDENVQKFVSEVIIVNNRSTDNSENAAIEYCKNNLNIPVKILRNDDNYNLGGSHKVAFNYATDNGFDYVITLHGDDQADIRDFIPLIQSGEYRNYDCCLGSRFMKKSKLQGYSAIRIFGNLVFNFLFTLICGVCIKDLGSGLNMYKVSMLSSRYYINYPDKLYFNALMILASCYYKHKFLFYPISWRESDQVSNAKLVSLSTAILKMLVLFKITPQKYLMKDFREKEIADYSAQIVFKK